MKKLFMLMAVIGLGLPSAFACDSDKDDNKKDGLRPTQEISTVYCDGDKGDKDRTAP
jgi:hypothetical protein